MGAVIEQIERVWDWPRTSRFAETSEQQKSLKASADFGAVAGGIVGGGLSMTFAQTHSFAMAVSFSAVLVGFYAGGLCWKVVNSRRPTL